jgi:hypothetical protein
VRAKRYPSLIHEAIFCEFANWARNIISSQSYSRTFVSFSPFRFCRNTRGRGIPYVAELIPPSSLLFFNSNILPTMDEQVFQVRNDLHNQFGSREWHLNLKAGPECVLALAECLILVSKPEVIALELKDPRLLYVPACQSQPSSQRKSIKVSLTCNIKGIPCFIRT